MSNNKLINIISNKNYESRETKNKLIYKLRKNGFETSERYDKDAILNICIGGDGAFLRAVHRNAFPIIPFVGINTGHLGFFQELQPSEIDEFISMYLAKAYIVEEICMVDAKVCTKEKCYYLTGINEIAVKGVKSKVIHIEMYIDNNHLQRVSGDGLIVSTPSGSTAYNFSAGGSIVYPSISSLQITPLAPINSSAYRSLPNSIIVSGESTIKIRPELKYENSILVVNDGMEFKYDNIEEVQMTMSNKHVNRLTFSKDSYWNNLKSKFL